MIFGGCECSVLGEFAIYKRFNDILKCWPILLSHINLFVNSIIYNA